MSIGSGGSFCRFEALRSVADAVSDGVNGGVMLLRRAPCPLKERLALPSLSDDDLDAGALRIEGLDMDAVA